MVLISSPSLSFFTPPPNSAWRTDCGLNWPTDHSRDIGDQARDADQWVPAQAPLPSNLAGRRKRWIFPECSSSRAGSIRQHGLQWPNGFGFFAGSSYWFCPLWASKGGLIKPSVSKNKGLSDSLATECSTPFFFPTFLILLSRSFFNCCIVCKK